MNGVSFLISLAILISSVIFGALSGWFVGQATGDPGAVFPPGLMLGLALAVIFGIAAVFMVVLNWAWGNWW